MAAFAHTHPPAISCDGERNWGLPEHKMQADAAKCEAIPDLRRNVPVPISVGVELEALQKGVDVVSTTSGSPASAWTTIGSFPSVSFGTVGAVGFVVGGGYTSDKVEGSK